MAELTISEAAAALGVSVDTVRRKIKRGEMQAHQDPRGKYLVQVDETEVERPQVDAEDNGQADMARLKLELVHSRAMLEELRHQRETLEAELQGTRQALQDAATERSEMRRLLGNAQMQLSQALPALGAGAAKPKAGRKHWYWPF
ncbi:MAG: excisionase family DNA-binding protein [Chloroflexi bacterium]|nr:excisionase family DNA-binding protein [Chloroflexota bacterium]